MVSGPTFLSLSPSLRRASETWLKNESDHRAEISENIVRYGALAPRPEILLPQFSGCACAVYLELNFLLISWEKISAKGQAKYIYVIHQPRGPYWEKLCPRSWYSRQRAQFFPIRTDLGW